MQSSLDHRQFKSESADLPGFKPCFSPELQNPGEMHASPSHLLFPLLEYGYDKMENLKFLKAIKESIILYAT